MIVKWIRCLVDKDQREAFSIAQKAWTELSTVPGFIIQLGGWDANDSGQACILGIWQDLSAYEAFMNKQHDEISDRNDQASNYSSIETRTYCSQFETPGTKNELAEAFSIPPALLVESFSMRPGQEKCLEDLLLGLQLPQSNAAGLIMGLVSKRQDAGEVLVATFWRDEQSANVCLENQSSRLKEFELDLESSNIENAVINLDDDWRVEHGGSYFNRERGASG